MTTGPLMTFEFAELSLTLYISWAGSFLPEKKVVSQRPTGPCALTWLVGAT